MEHAIYVTGKKNQTISLANKIIMIKTTRKKMWQLGLTFIKTTQFKLVDNIHLLCTVDSWLMDASVVLLCLLIYSTDMTKYDGIGILIVTITFRNLSQFKTICDVHASDKTNIPTARENTHLSELDFLKTWKCPCVTARTTSLHYMQS